MRLNFFYIIIRIQEKIFIAQKGKLPKGIYFLLYGKVHLIGSIAYAAKGFPFRKLLPGSFFGENIFLEEGSKYDIV